MNKGVHKCILQDFKTSNFSNTDMEFGASTGCKQNPPGPSSFWLIGGGVRGLMWKSHLWGWKEAGKVQTGVSQVVAAIT